MLPHRKLKKLLRRRKSDLEEEVNKTLQRHEKDHMLGPFTGLSPEYMEMSESRPPHIQVTVFNFILDFRLYS